MAAALIAIQSWFGQRTRSDRGASLVEYALLIVLIAVVCAVAVGFLGNSASSSFSATGSGLTAN
jgi:pilus assembly protein Flp/PilA